jgi:hypothetical protein
MTQHTIIAHPYLGFLKKTPCFRVWFLNFGLSIWNIRIHYVCLLDLNEGFLNKEMDWAPSFWIHEWADLICTQDKILWCKGADLAWALCIWVKSLFNTRARLLDGLGLFGLEFKLLEHMDSRHKMLNTLALSSAFLALSFCALHGPMYKHVV